MQEDLRLVRGASAVSAALAAAARRQVQQPHRFEEVQDKEVREERTARRLAVRFHPESTFGARRSCA
eukprot:scaffold26462_cov46-Phaeocystis_antarctica.AAC.1